MTDMFLTQRRMTLVAAMLCLVLQGTTAQAQQLVIDGSTSPGLNIQNFEPTPSPYGIFGVDSAQSIASFEVAGGLMLNFAKDPLVLVPEGGDAQPLVEDQLAGDVLFAIGLYDVVELGLDLPIYFLNEAQIDNADLSGATVGDMILRPKFTILNPEQNPVGLALYANVSFPTGDPEAFTGTGGFGVRPGLIVDTKIDNRLLVALNLGANIQEEQNFGNLSVGSEMTFGLGAQYDLVPQTWALGAEIFGASSFNNLFETEETPLEGLIGLKYRSPIGLNFEAGAGGGLVEGYGSPAYRIIFGVMYENFDDDWDDDGILNGADLCARVPEDRDLFEDEDGCPEPDNDQDGLCDPGMSDASCSGEDSCPNEPEDKDEFEDEDGCPDPDNDKDGIADVSDKCPLTPGQPEYEGCPVPDKDGDGIADNKDTCPEKPEDKDGFKDGDGCPDHDNDNDGILDKKDSCKGTDAEIEKGIDTAEDKDGFQDEDGCPDPDNDGDGIPDTADKCPNEAEVLNGVKDEDGCPDKGKPLVTRELKILERVYFDVGKSTIKRRSFPLLNAVALVLKGRPEITLVEIQGHTDDQGNDDMNLRLSDDRAKAVREYLIGQGIDPERMTSKGYGETTPAKPIDELRGLELRRAREANRRVQFEIIKRSDQ